MSNQPEKMKIDPEKFAYSVINNFQSTSDDNQRIAKDHLTLFLQSYYLITQFNELESNQFSYFKDTDMNKLFTSLSKISEHQ
ncbi:hypothetical protein [Latilactobacillus fuchuensis]|uniref:Uncharacterized protein n=1 Tax=Latilactobacillus fuchuensis TaxID=164393 RepID=A0A2N9DUV8_9LACO|nr:hypothetical protein [Latilactobacillus fuchuensis]SPC37978.1 conserved hypothetical protein [Latilactobacillus fuchuensis]